MKDADTRVNTSARPVVEVKRDTIVVQYDKCPQEDVLETIREHLFEDVDDVTSCTLVPQSQEKVIYEANDTSTHENVTFTDDTGGYAYDLDDYVDPTRMMQDSDTADLGAFFSRPIKILDRVWEINTVFQQNFDPCQF
mgnify:FL=1